MYQSPRRAKRLYFDVIPRQVDEYLAHLRAFEGQEPAARLANPVWHIHAGKPPVEKLPLGFGLLLNLASVSNTEDKKVLWGFVSRYAADAGPEDHPMLDALIGYAIAYYRDFVKPAKHYRAPSEMEHAALAELAGALGALPADATAEAIQEEVYEIGKRHPFEGLRAWFRALYEILLGQSEGPRMGSFIALYGVGESIALIERALAGEDLGAE
jgi:lysyl-tRNA synthetase class 1